MHEPGQHTLLPLRPRRISTEYSAGFVDELYGLSRDCSDPDCSLHATRRKMNRLAYIERRTEHPGLVSLSTAHRKLAAILLKRDRSAGGWRPLRGARTAMEPLGAWEVDELVLDLCRVGAVDVRLAPDYQPTHYKVVEESLLQEIARPGLAAKTRQALDHARSIIGGVSGPEADAVRRLIESEAATSWPPDAVMAAAAVARHAIEDRVLPMRVVSTAWLAGRATEVSASKAIEHHATRLETLFGRPLIDLGLRPHAPLVTIGGAGLLESDFPIRLEEHAPFLAFPASRLLRMRGIQPADEGLFLVENRNVFEAACYDEIPEMQGCMILYTGGMVGPSEQWFAERAFEVGAKIRFWFDLDGEGILSARLLRGWTKDAAVPYRMNPREVHAATRVEPLEGQKLKTLERLAADGGFLSELAQTLLDRECWIEQESQLLTG